MGSPSVPVLAALLGALPAACTFNPAGVAATPGADAQPPDARPPTDTAGVPDTAPVDVPSVDGPADAPPDAPPPDASLVGITGSLTADDPGRFADGVLAVSCEDYRRPSPGYTYAGTTGDGTYRIDVDGFGPLASVAVFCDMTTDGGGWTAIVANGDASVDETTAAADCYPLIGPDAATGCGDPANLDQDFSLAGSVQAGLSWRYLLAVALGGSGYTDKQAYFAIDFGVSAVTSTERNGGTAYTPPGLATTYGIIHCTNRTDSWIVHYGKAGDPCNDRPGNVANDRGTVFGHSSGADMCDSARGTFGFTDRSAAGGSSLRGVDDYQDGWSCGDQWAPKAVRGRRMVVLVR